MDAVDERPPRIETLPIAEITRDPQIKSREIDPAVVEECVADMTRGDRFPPETA